jgi:hypothetical protein
LQRLLAAAGRDDRLPGQFERIAYRLAQCGVVLNNQNRESLSAIRSSLPQ